MSAAAERPSEPRLTTEQIDQVVDRFVAVARRFDDLEYCNADGVLRLRTPLPNVTAIRIELPGLASLQLASVVVDGAGLDDPVGQARLTTSKPANARPTAAVDSVAA